MTIRQARLKDVNDCYSISRQENEKYWKKSDFQSSINDKNSIFLVAEEDDNITGYIRGFIVPGKNDEAMIHEARVSMSYRGNRIGTKLVEKFYKEAFKKGAKVVYALIEPNLKSFYVDSCNFKETGYWIETSIKAKK